MTDFFDNNGRWKNALWNFKQYLMSVTYLIDRRMIEKGGEGE